MFAEQNKSADIPAHDEHPDGDTHQGSADGINIAKILRRKEQRICAEGIHKATIYHQEHYEPKKQKDLVFPEVQEQ